MCVCVFALPHTGVCEVDLQNKAGYTTVMLASLTAPDGSGDMEVVRRLMELGDVNARASQVTTSITAKYTPHTSS